MRRDRIAWTYKVVAILLIMYGGFFVIYDHDKDKSIFIFSIIALVVGVLMLAIYVGVYFYSKNKKVEPKEEVPNEVEQVEEKKKENIAEEKKVITTLPKRDYEYVSSKRVSRSRYDSDDNYNSATDEEK